MAASGFPYALPETPRPWAVVLDTHVLLDWVVFEDSRIAPLQQALALGHLQWVGSPSMLNEACDVVQRGSLAKWSARVEPLQTLWQRWVREVAEPPPAPGGLRCRDPDDQKFANLALAHGAHWLLSRDRALLALRKPLARHGVCVMTPEAWCQGWTSWPEP